jgi:hypothetical protein
MRAVLAVDRSEVTIEILGLTVRILAVATAHVKARGSRLGIF